MAEAESSDNGKEDIADVINRLGRNLPLDTEILGAANEFGNYLTTDLHQEFERLGITANSDTFHYSNTDEGWLSVNIAPVFNFFNDAPIHNAWRVYVNRPDPTFNDYSADRRERILSSDYALYTDRRLVAVQHGAITFPVEDFYKLRPDVNVPPIICWNEDEQWLRYHEDYMLTSPMAAADDDIPGRLQDIQHYNQTLAPLLGYLSKLPSAA